MALLGLKISKLHVSICKIGGYFFSCLCPKVVLRIKIINMKALCKGKHFEKMLSVIISVINDNNWVSEKGSKVNTWPFSIATLGVWPIFHCNILEKRPPPLLLCPNFLYSLGVFKSAFQHILGSQGQTGLPLRVELAPSLLTCSLSLQSVAGLGDRLSKVSQDSE